MTQFTKAQVVRERLRPPTDDEFNLIIAGLEQLYALPPQKRDWFNYDEMRLCLRDLDFTSTPGIPYMREAPTIGKWLGWNGLDSFDEKQVERLWYDVKLCLAGEYDHVFRAFVKEEPHKVAKIQQKRWRLIMCAALPMQMLWRMATKHQNDWLNSHPYDSPSAHGLVFCYGGWRRFQAHVRALGIKYSRDISSWDVNAPGWVFRVIREWRKRAGGPADWLIALDVLYDDAYVNSKIKFSNGLVVRQQYEGTMKSGLFVTIADNSVAQVAIDIAASLRSGQRRGNMKATGDDVIQQYCSDPYLDELGNLGCVVKEIEASLIFMGTDFNREPTPMYLEKHIVNFWTTSSYEAERLDAYCRLWCHSNKWFAFWSELARVSGVTTHSQSYYRFWYDNPIARLLDVIG